MSHNDVEYCKGCYAGFQDNCNGMYNQRGKCPCSKCLIKVMCMDECAEYSKFTHRISRLIDAGIPKHEVGNVIYSWKRK